MDRFRLSIIVGLVLLFLVGVIFISSGDAQVINNSASGQVGADSLAIPFYFLDGSGYLSLLNLDDSVFLTVFYPDGSLAFKDSLPYNGINISAVAQSSFTTYVWAEAGNVLDGPNQIDGVYSYTIVIKDDGTGNALPLRGYFQLFTIRDYHVALDLASDTSLYMTGGLILDSLRWAQGVGLGSFSFSVRTADEDSLFYGVGTDTLYMKIYQNKLSGNATSKVIAYSLR